VDTYRGTGRGVPRLCGLLADHQVRGTFYFSVGPDNMGRHLWRLLRPTFLWKMLRTNAGGLYGYDIIFMGTAWRGLEIGKHLGGVIKSAEAAGHEVGLHAYDHYSAQAKIDRWSPARVAKELDDGYRALTAILGHPPATSATPGWRCTSAVLLEKSKKPFSYNSDCRGDHPFYPAVGSERLEQLQVPVTLPTYDEMLGRDGVTDLNYNDRLIALLREDRPNVLTIHAEAEGGKCAAMFSEFLTRCQADNWEFVPLAAIAEEYRTSAPLGRVVQKPFPGREGWLAQQEDIVE